LVGPGKGLFWDGVTGAVWRGPEKDRSGLVEIKSKSLFHRTGGLLPFIRGFARDE